MMDRGEILEGARPQNEAYEGLKHQILSLDIEPGEMLSESILSSQMNVGRPLMRDALAQLAEEGYVMVYPQKGTAVTMIDPERVRQAVHTHIVLEQAVLAEACQQGLTGAQLEYLECILEEQKRRGDDAVKRMILERQMSNALAAFCGKKYMLDVFRTMDCDMLRVKCLHYNTFGFPAQMFPPSSWKYTQVEGRMLVDNLRRRDTDAAWLLCSNHFKMVLLHMDSLRGIYPQFFSG